MAEKGDGNMFTDILISIFGGGATGIFGSLLGRFTSMWEKKQERKFIIEKHKLDAQLRAQEAEQERQIIDMEASQATLRASYRHDSKIGATSSWVQNVRALVRPTLTGLLWGLVGVIWFTVPEGFDRMDLVQSVLYAATTATVWWFGDRGCKKY